MNKINSQTKIFKDTKKHYQILDGLRGVAAIFVVLFHVFEIFSGGDHTKQILNHGYLAVDFFFVLSGFVIAHAYDDRWAKMDLKSFFKRRLIRLQPMIIFGMTVGAICFYFSASQDLFPLVAETPIWQLILYMLLGYFLIPVPISMDIRGWQEMYPLNGPAWSLFFEYIANILYALILRKISNRILYILCLLAGALLIHMAFTSPKGDIIGGWSLNAEQLHIGFSRLLYPFLIGIVISRTISLTKIRNGFLWCSLLLILVLSFPRLGGYEDLWMNALYDSLIVILVFPIIIYIGASSSISNIIASKICNFLGDISYPLYIVHFPIVYIYYAWIVNKNVPLQGAWIEGILVVFISIAIAYISLKYFDIPLRRWLTSKLFSKEKLKKKN